MWLFIPCTPKTDGDKKQVACVLRELGYRWNGGELFSEEDFTHKNWLANIGYLCVNVSHKRLRYSRSFSYTELLTPGTTAGEYLKNRLVLPEVELIMSLANGDPHVGFNLFIGRMKEILLEAESYVPSST